MWAILLIILLFVNPSEADTEEGQTPYPNIIRLHIIANSNDTDDQKLKLIVRDKVLAKFDLSYIEDHGQAWQYLEENLVGINDFCKEIIKEKGYNYEVKSQLIIEEFPDKEYGDQLYPEGEYQALKIIIGEGQGKNWWCVLYPPLCHEALFDETENQVMQVNGNVYKEEIKEKSDFEEILELFFDVFKNIWLF